MATEIEKISTYQTPGASHEKELKNLSQLKLLAGGVVPPWWPLAKLISFPNKIGSTKEKPIFIEAIKSVKVTSHLYGFR